MSEIMTGKKALLEMLKAEGVEYIFGNPGTSEGPIIDMLGDYPEFKYILALQESVAVGMGESYARATETASFVSLHVDSGLANGIALMLDALNTGTPMVVTSANYDVRKITENKTDLAELVRPVTKWAVELTHPDQIPSAMRRAFNEANSHPKGPVYVGFTANALEGTAEMNIIPSTKIFDETRPSIQGIKESASLLVESEKPIMIVGDRASDDHAVNEAIELAELLGLPVYQSRGAEVAFPTTHPQFMGNLSLRVADHREILKRVDLVLTVGMDTFEELFYWGDPILNQDVKLIHIDPVPGKVGKSEPVSVGIISHCKLALNELIKTVKPLLNDKSNEIISKRKNTISKEFEESQKTYEESDPLPIYNAKWGPIYIPPPPAPWVKYDLEFSSYTERKKRINTDKYDDLTGKFIIPTWLSDSTTGSSIDVGFRAFMPFSMTYIEAKFQRNLDGSKVVEISRIHEPTGYNYWKYPINLRAETPDVYGITEFKLSIVGNQLILIADGETHIIQGTPIDFATEYLKDIEYFTNKDQLYLYPPSNDDKEENLIIDKVTLWNEKEIVIP